MATNFPRKAIVLSITNILELHILLADLVGPEVYSRTHPILQHLRQRPFTYIPGYPKCCQCNVLVATNQVLVRDTTSGPEREAEREEWRGDSERVGAAVRERRREKIEQRQSIPLPRGNVKLMAGK